MIIVLLALLAIVFMFGFAGMAQMLRSQKLAQSKLSSSI
jgi:Tfp pilus assembly protein FimT